MNRILLFALALAVLGAPALAMHREDLPEVERLADRLVRSADRMLDYADGRSSPFARDDWRVERSLRRFARSADRFRDRVDRYFDDSRPVYRSLEELNEDAAIVSGRISRIPVLSPVRTEWDRATRTLARLNRLVGDAPSIHARPGRYYDRDSAVRRSITRRVLQEIEE